MPGRYGPTSGSGQLTGTFDGAGFTVSIVSPQGVLLLTLGCIAERQPIRVPVDGDTASARFRYLAPSGDVYECTWELELTQTVA